MDKENENTVVETSTVSETTQIVGESPEVVVATDTNEIQPMDIAPEDRKILEDLSAENTRRHRTNYLKIFTNGIITSNPVFKLCLGTCPVLAVTTALTNGFAMGMATTLVLICSNVLISLLRKVIPDRVRIPAYVLIIATFVTIVQMVMKKFLPSINAALGVYIPLIVVNCIILGRAEAFANSNPVGASAMDGLGMGLGFTLALCVLAFFRELLGAGAVFGYKIPVLSDYAMTIFILPAGGFLTFGLLMAAVTVIVSRVENRRVKEAKQ